MPRYLCMCESEASVTVEADSRPRAVLSAEEFFREAVYDEKVEVDCSCREVE